MFTLSLSPTNRYHEVLFTCQWIMLVLSVYEPRVICYVVNVHLHYLLLVCDQCLCLCTSLLETNHSVKANNSICFDMSQCGSSSFSSNLPAIPLILLCGDFAVRGMFTVHGDHGFAKNSNGTMINKYLDQICMNLLPFLICEFSRILSKILNTSHRQQSK